MAHANPLFAATGAQLRSLALAGDQAALAEIQRRKAKVERAIATGEHVTIASLRANGHADKADLRIEAAKVAASLAKSAKAQAKAAAAPVAVLTRTTEVAAPAKTGRDSLAKVRADLEPRIASIEQAVLTLANLAKGQHELLTALSARALKG